MHIQYANYVVNLLESGGRECQGGAWRGSWLVGGWVDAWVVMVTAAIMMDDDNDG